MLELKEVKKYYKSQKAVDGISFTIKKGEIFGLIGSNGAGKSTTVSMIATLLKPNKSSGGEILFHGINIVKDPGFIRKRLGFVPQEISLYQNLTGMDNMIFWGNIYKIPRDILSQRIRKVCDMVGLSRETLSKRVETYSGGLKRRLNISVALLHEPEFLILDEPTVGIDLIVRNQILDFIKNINNAGTTILYCSHYMEEINQICDTLCIMENGKILLCDDKDKLLYTKGSERTLENLYYEVLGQG
ncbi:MAG: transporter related [Clostridia bacterium]|jgi:ABC-2 type transport system ATP-binding protein|nr:transporter related [Clostridia bacterium]